MQEAFEPITVMKIIKIDEAIHFYTEKQESMIAASFQGAKKVALQQQQSATLTSAFKKIYPHNSLLKITTIIMNYQHNTNATDTKNNFSQKMIEALKPFLFVKNVKKH